MSDWWIITRWADDGDVFKRRRDDGSPGRQRPARTFLANHLHYHAHHARSVHQHRPAPTFPWLVCLERPSRFTLPSRPNLNHCQTHTQTYTHTHAGTLTDPHLHTRLVCVHRRDGGHRNWHCQQHGHHHLSLHSDWSTRSDQSIHQSLCWRDRNETHTGWLMDDESAFFGLRRQSRRTDAGIRCSDDGETQRERNRERDSDEDTKWERESMRVRGWSSPVG